MEKRVLNAPIRWTGSKRKLLNEMLDRAFIKKKKNYVECFLGSGVVLINVLNNNKYLKYSNFYVNDINSSLINFYILLRDNYEELSNYIEDIIREYNNLESNKKSDYYYKKREEYNNIIKDNLYKAACFYFLTKTCFNGVYRENKNGKYNVPFGKKELIIYDKEYLKKLSLLIKHVEFYNLDYKDFLKIIKEKCNSEETFIYFDPPYLPEDSSKSKAQLSYNKNGFDHLAFVNYLDNIQEYKYMISMPQSRLEKQIYGKKYKRKKMAKIIRVINPNYPINSKELAITNYLISNKKKTKN